MGLRTGEADAGNIPMSDSASDTFEALFNAHWGRIYRVLFRLVGDPSEAEDLALEVFWRLYQKPPKQRADNNLESWLYRVATNLGYNALRARRRRTFYEDAANDLGGASSFDETSTEVERRIERNRVRAVLRSMKPRAAKILILRHSGLSYSELASTLGLAPGSVGTILSRAQREFAERYAAWQGENHETS